MSELPALELSKAIHRLSGDHRGLPGGVSLLEVSCTRLRPSRSQTQSSMLPERAELNAIRSPLGENWGSKSSCVEAINLTGALFLSIEFGPGIRQMLESKTSWV